MGLVFYVTIKKRFHVNKSAPNFQNRVTVVTIEKRGNNPILTSKLYALLHFMTPSKQICSTLLEKG